MKRRYYISKKDPSNEKVQEQLFAVQQRMDAMSAWEANANAKSLLTKLGITDFTAIVGNLSGGQKKTYCDGAVFY